MSETNRETNRNGYQKQIVVGKVEATLNGYNVLNISPLAPISTEQIDRTLVISAPEVKAHMENFANPHRVTKAQLGLGVVENKNSEAIRSEITSSNVTTALGYVPPTKDVATHISDGLESKQDKINLDFLMESEPTFVKSVDSGIGLTGGPVTRNGTIKLNLKNESRQTLDSVEYTNTENRQYPVGVDHSGFVSVNVPWTDTTYPLVSHVTDGRMTKEDKIKLDDIQEHSEENQNAYSIIQVDETVIPSTEKIDRVTFTTGHNVILTPNQSTKTVSIAAVDTTYDPATQNVHGLHSKEDKKKLDSIAYGECTTAAGTAAKVVTIVKSSSIENWRLIKGSRILVKFTNANTAANVTINVDSTGAKSIKHYGTTGNFNTYTWNAGSILEFVYDGTNFIMVAGSHATTSTYGMTKLNSSHADTSEVTAATPKAVKDTYDMAFKKLDKITLQATAPVSVSGDTTLDDTKKTGTITITHDTSGVTAGNYGTAGTADVKPAFGATFSVISASVTDKGHISKMEQHNVKIPTLTVGSLLTSGAHIGTITINGAENKIYQKTKLTLGASQATSNASSDVSNPFINLFDNTTYSSQVQINGDTWLIAKGKNGVVNFTHKTTPAITDNSTSLSKGLNAAATPEFGGSFNVPYVTIDRTGHVTDLNHYSVTVPSPTISATITEGATIGTIKINDTTTTFKQKTHLYLGANNATTNATSDVDNPYIRLFDNTTASDSVRVVGSSPIIAKGKNGEITLSHATYTARTSTVADESPGFGGTFTVDALSSNGNGHVTDLVAKTITLPTLTASNANSNAGSDIGSVTINGSAVTFKHPKALSTAQTTAALYNVKINTDGHIAEATKVTAGTNISLDSNKITNTYAHPTYTARTGSTTAVSNLGFGSNIILDTFTSDGTGHITALNQRNVKIPDTKANVDGTYGITTLTSSIDNTEAKAATPKAVNTVKATAEAALPKSGGTMTGALVLSGDPTTNLGAATKQYADSRVGVINVNSFIPSQDKDIKANWNNQKGFGVYKTNGDNIIYNQPQAFGFVMHISGNDSVQMFLPYDSNKLYLRSNENNIDTWKAWRQVDSGTVNGHTVLSNVPANAVFTDTNTKVTAVGNHYTPSGGTTTSASGGTLTDITNSGSGVQVLTGITKDAAGHVTGVTSVGLKSVNTNTTYSAGTGLSLSGTTFSNSGVTGIKLGSSATASTGVVTVSPSSIGASASNHNHDSTYAAKTHTHDVATSSAKGFMSADDKSKIDDVITIVNGQPKRYVNAEIFNVESYEVSGGNFPGRIHFKLPGTNDVQMGMKYGDWTTFEVSGPNLNFDVIGTIKQNGTAVSLNGHTHSQYLTSHQSLSGYVPTTRNVNNNPLSSDITLTASDVGAAASNHTHTLSDLGAASSSHTHTVATTSANGFMSSDMVTKLNGIAAGATANTGTVTAVKINGTTKNPTNGVVDLGTVSTSSGSTYSVATADTLGVVYLSSDQTSSRTDTAPTTYLLKNWMDLKANYTHSHSEYLTSSSISNVLTAVSLNNPSLSYSSGTLTFKNGGLSYTKYGGSQGTSSQSTTTINITAGSIGAATSSHAHALTGTDITGVLPIAKGGTGNSNGYIQTGQKNGTTLGTGATAEGGNNTSSNLYSHAEGSNNTASGQNSHAEGYGTTASNSRTHAEGYNTTASADSSHAEGFLTVASGKYSHAEGAGYNEEVISEYGFAHYTYNDGSNYNTQSSNPMPSEAMGLASHVEGHACLAVGWASHAEGAGSVAEGSHSHAGGFRSVTTGSGSYAHGSDCRASGVDSIAIGNNCISSGDCSHAEGEGSIASGNYSFAHGGHVDISPSEVYLPADSIDGSIITTDSSYRPDLTIKVESVGDYSHAEGLGTRSIGRGSHSEGRNTIARGDYSHAGGVRSFAGGTSSFAHGNSVSATRAHQAAFGKYNNSTTDDFIVGHGSSESSRSNIFAVNSSRAWAPSFSSSGADYAEMFEWADGNPDEEDRRGRFVTLDGDYIKIVSDEDEFILGVVSGNPTVLGDAYDNQWKGMYECDVYGTPIYEDVEVPAEVSIHKDPETGEEKKEIILEAYVDHRRKLNPEYNPSVKYIPRSERPEWAAVGMVGKLVMADDGTAEVNGYVKPSTGGIATKSEEKTKYRVMKRLDENHIKVLILP